MSAKNFSSRLGTIFAVAFVLFINTVPPTLAQETPEALVANAGEDRNVAVGRTVLFDAAGSLVPTTAAQVQYYWDFGDGQAADGIDATHVYTEGGTYRAKLTVEATIPPPTAPEGEEQTAAEQKLHSEAVIIVSVQEKLVTLIADQNVPQTKITELQNYALTRGTLLIPIRAAEVEQEYLAVQNLAQQILKNAENISGSEIIITWTAGSSGLHAFNELSRVATLNNTSLENLQLNKKAIVAITNQSLLSTAKIAQSVFNSIQPQYLVVANEAILDDVLQYAHPETLKNNLAFSGAAYRLVTAYTARGWQKLGPLNFLSSIESYLINQGVPINAIFLTLMLPIMATIVALSRQLIGIKSLGIFVPTILSLSLLFTGLKYGAAVFVAILFVGTLVRALSRRIRLLYLPRMAMVLSILALTTLAMLWVGAALNKTGFLSVSIFPILIMALLTEHFVAIQMEQGYKPALILTFETLALAIAGYLLGSWDLFQTTLLAYPELIFITFIINYLLGKFSGLRLTEYLRFHQVIKKLRHVEK